MKRISIFGCAALLGLAANGIPAKPGYFNYRQPDGATVKVRLVGDERSHHYVAEDGRELLPQDGYLVDYIYNIESEEINADHSPDQAAPAAGPGLRPEKTFPSSGTPRALVVLVEYADLQFSTPGAADYFTRMLTQEGFADYGATGSASDFFRENSCGAFQPQFDVVGPLTLSREMAYYGADNAMRRDHRAWEMAVEACQLLDDTTDFTLYDNDGDGLIDNIFIFYAGEGQSSGGSADSVWPHSWTLDEATAGTYLFDGVRLNRYGCANEWENGRPDGVGTFVHEFSHVLGLPDLYTTNNSKAFTPGPWSTLDAGPYNNDGMTPPFYGAYERYSLGWLDPTEITGPSTLTLSPVGLNQGCIIPTADPNEFFLLENRQQTGWDSHIPGHGLLIWHIHYDPAVWAAAAVNNTVNHQYVDLEEADGIKSEATRAGDPFPGTFGVTEFTDETYPSMLAWDGTSLNLPVTDIAENPDGTVTFKVAGGSAAVNLPGAEPSAPLRYTLDGLSLTVEAPAPVQVTTAGGQSFLLPEGAAACTLPSPGLYLLRCGDSVTKLIVR